ncbi:MAG: aminotransferase class I/II-fold pyridoxal phosphate-dependent enzyme [Bacteroidia bacterium]|nr:aminotransferase class I/II-fold pyridoxal phosphate-dependent enzyme [Bacteroidia bacterium]
MEENWIDLRSDTVTMPTAGMKDAMMNAEVGDDVFGEDKTVNALQEYAANLFGMEAALFCSSGTQTNQIAIKVHTQPGDEVICDQLAHVYLFEGGGIAFNSGASVRLLNGERGKFTADQVLENINKDDVHFPTTRLVCIENTVNKGGGACWDLQELKKIKRVCNEHKLAFHLDGARLFNAMEARNEQAKEYGTLFDTISICLSKGLGAPVGSLLLGSELHIYKARRLRKIFGGGMRQAGFIAAAGLYALKNNVMRLNEDHDRAKITAELLSSKSFVEFVLPVETNLVIFKIKETKSVVAFLEELAKNKIKAVSMGKNLVRFVFHLNHTANDMKRLYDYLKNSS